VSRPHAGLVVALARECRSLRCTPPVGAVTALGPRAMIFVAGMGTGNAARGAAELVAAGATGLLSWGCAGGLARDAASGDLCLPTAVVSTRGDLLAVDPAWRARVLEAIDSNLVVHAGTIVTRERPAASPDAKGALAAAHPDAVAVDMESAAVAAVAQAHALPFLALRAIVDTVDFGLPSSALAASDAGGADALVAVTGALARRPGEIADLLRLARSFRAAMRTLARVASLTGEDFLLPARPPRAAP